jgi:hypothetical protein
LWFNFLRILLHYAEKAQEMKNEGNFLESVKPLVQNVSDNTQRVMAFLLQLNILVDQDAPADLPNLQQRKDLYKKTKEVLGTFWGSSQL